MANLSLKTLTGDNERIGESLTWMLHLTAMRSAAEDATSDELCVLQTPPKLVDASQLPSSMATLILETAASRASPSIFRLMVPSIRRNPRRTRRRKPAGHILEPILGSKITQMRHLLLKIHR
jgi:hypothetical protein